MSKKVYGLIIGNFKRTILFKKKIKKLLGGRKYACYVYVNYVCPTEVE